MFSSFNTTKLNRGAIRDEMLAVQAPSVAPLHLLSPFRLTERLHFSVISRPPLTL